MAPRICSYCNKPVILNPSASERSKRYGESPAFYINLFPNHSACSVAAREAETVQLMRRINQESRHALQSQTV